ncbi:MAG: sigma-70 family RNA polymerase sigma factor [Lachnospiraceae bacterium]|nr:sigma-70 family RNA polymerase sigma factor [Lachnospiraceae bacterium]
MKSFQKPLSSEEEAYYICLLQSGTETEKARAKEVLIERNLRLVAHIAKKYQNTEEDMEDLISIGTIGLIKAIASFQSEKGRLATYACRCIDNELLMLFRSKKKSAREVSLYEPIGTDKEGKEITQREIGERLGISRSYVSRIEKRALEKLREFF